MEATTNQARMNTEAVTCDYCGTTLSLKIISWGNRHSCYTCYECNRQA